MRSTPAPCLLARLPILLMSAVFALGFGLGGLLAGVRPILLTLAEAWEVRNWRPMGATVQEVELLEHRGSKGGRTYGLRVLAWVDPRHPERAVLDPHIRWALVALQLPFALLFTSVGAAAAWVFWRTCRGEPMPDRAAGRRPGRRLAHGAAALLWCGLTWPLVVLVWWTDAHWVPRLVVTGFGLVGLGLLQAWQREKR